MQGNERQQFRYFLLCSLTAVTQEVMSLYTINTHPYT